MGRSGEWRSITAQPECPVIEGIGGRWVKEGFFPCRGDGAERLLAAHEGYDAYRRLCGAFTARWVPAPALGTLRAGRVEAARYGTVMSRRDSRTWYRACGGGATIGSQCLAAGKRTRGRGCGCRLGGLPGSCEAVHGLKVRASRAVEPEVDAQRALRAMFWAPDGIRPVRHR